MPELGNHWAVPAAEVVARLDSRTTGLTSDEAATRLETFGPNRLTPHHRSGVLLELRRQFTQPIVLILVAATLLSLLLGDRVDAVIILGIVVLSGLLGFFQEHGAEVTVARLLERVQIHVEVRRDGTVVSVRPEDVVPGDVVVLNAGDVVPCDCRLLTAESLQVDESALTGETYPRHKHPDPASRDAVLAERHSSLFQGSHVVSGQGDAIAVVTGGSTELGQMSSTLVGAPPPTSFERGTARFGLLLAWVTAVLTATILVVNLLLGRPAIDAVLFSLALAVGVTPQMLPAIVSVSLSTGARRMAHAKVIVRRLDAIEDLGSMDTLCTDKTGTLTQGSITLAAAVDLAGNDSELVAERAAVNAATQTGFTNPLDDAILAAHRPSAIRQTLGELPFDFERKRLSVLVDDPDGRLLVTKGAYRSVVGVCTQARTAHGVRPLEEVRAEVDDRFHELSAAGYRVLALAEKSMPGRSDLVPGDEQDMVLLGLLAFQDPPKPGLKATVNALEALSIRMCMLTGDNHLTARHVARSVGIEDPTVLTGSDVDALDDDQLARTAATVDAFAELTPTHKERIIEALRSSGSVVGYLGDGINDAGPLHLADVGISVDSAVDVAKSAAAMVLLDKDLDVVVAGVRLGRQTFANTLKYIYTTISANFGNVASMAAASAFLPFLPMLPRQILLLNFLSDLPSLTIAGDRVDEEAVASPRRWDLHQVRNFMVVFGLLSSVFDLLTFAILIVVFDAHATLFRTGWFVGSALTELAVLFVLRTRRLAFRSTPSVALVVTSVVVAAVTILLPFVPAIADPMGLVPLSGSIVATLIAITTTYVLAAEVTKRVFYRPRHRPSPPPRPSRPARVRRLEHLAFEHGRHHPRR